MNIIFTHKQTEYISDQVQQGDYQNASEVVRDALRLHEIYRHKIIEDLHAEVSKGWIKNTSNKTIRDILTKKRNRNKYRTSKMGAYELSLTTEKHR